MTQESIKQAYREAVAKGLDPIEIPFDKFEKEYASNSTADQKFHKIYTESIINGRLDPSETTIDEFIKIANILFENMDEGSIYKGSVDDSAIKQQLLKAAQSLDEDEKEDALFDIENEDFLSVLQYFKDNRVVINQVVSYLEQQNDFNSKLELAKCYSKYIGNKTKSIEVLQQAEQKIKTFSDVQDLYYEVQNLEDPKWIEQIISNAKPLIKNVYDATFAVEILLDNIDNKVLAKELLTVGLSKVENLEDMIEIIQCVNKYLQDKEWADMLLKDGEKYLHASQDYANMLAVIKDPYQAFLYVVEAIELMKDSDDAEILSFLLPSVPGYKDSVFEDIALLCTQQEIENLKQKYKKPSPDELKKKYGESLAHGTITAGEVDYKEFETNYWKYQSEIEVPVAGKTEDAASCKKSIDDVVINWIDRNGNLVNWLEQFTEPLTQDNSLIHIKSSWKYNTLIKELADLDNLKCINATETEVDDFSNLLSSDTLEMIQLPQGYSDEYQNKNFVFGYNQNFEPIYVSKNSDINLLIPCFQLEGYGAYSAVGSISGKDFYKVLTDPSVDNLYDLDSFELIEVGEYQFEIKSACNGEVIFSYRGEQPDFSVLDFS